jgi:heat shock protein HslJ
MLSTSHRLSSFTTTRRLAVATLACAVALMSCGDDSTSSSDAGKAPAAADLDGRSFLSTKVEGQTLVEGTQVTLTFTADTLSAVAGCNTMTGGYTIDGGTLKVAAMAQTLMACDPETMAQDVWVSALLTGSPTVSLAADELAVKGADTTLTLGDRTKVANENALDGRTWDLVSLDAATAPEGAYVSVADGKLYVATGCNRGFGSVTVTDGAIEIGPIALTRMACEGATNEWEQALTTFLTGSLDYVVTGTDVTLTNGTQTLTLTEAP